MKKTLLLVLAAVATIFTSCSSDINNDNDDSNNGQGKGMTLIANVEQDDTRATLTTSDDISGKWSFAYTDNDKVKVGNDKIDNYYTFTKNGETFSCADALATKQETNWYAYYPGTDIDLTNQDGKADGSAAKLYALAGATKTATTGAAGLTIDMKAKAAVLRIVKVDNYGPCDIYLKTKEGKYVSGLKAKQNEAGFEVETSDKKVSVFKKNNTDKAEIYYVIVPAGVKIEVWNDNKRIKTTKAAGLKAGKYYTLTSGPTTGTATYTLADGTTKPVGWVQLWIGGPRIATENVANKMSWDDAVKTGGDYVWGANWRTPSKADLQDIAHDDGSPKFVEINLITDNGVKHFKYKGTQPGYISNLMTIPYTDKDQGGVYWTSSTNGQKDQYGRLKGTSLTITDYGDYGIYSHFGDFSHRGAYYYVRPVLNKETVLWGDQNIK